MQQAEPTRNENSKNAPDKPVAKRALADYARPILGGGLMGLANLVPGISGGTMLVATGIYEQFVEAVADVTRLRFKLRSIIFLGVVALAAVFAIMLLAGPVKFLVHEHRWVMSSLFIGFTLGGVPIIWKMLPHRSAGVWMSAVCGFAFMVGVAFLQNANSGEVKSQTAWYLMFSAGAVAAGAMVLPGISGAYLLQVMRVYVPILTGVKLFSSALKKMDFSAMSEPICTILLPVGLGVLVGIAGISNLFKFLFKRFETQTLGVLLGLLVGAVAGLYPFQQGVAPQVGDIVQGKKLTAQALADLDPGKYPSEFFTPNATQIVLAILLIFAGFAATMLIAKVGKNGKADSEISSGDNNE